MADEKLVEFVKKAASHKYTPKEVRRFLIEQGHNASEVDDAIRVVAKSPMVEDKKDDKRAREDKDKKEYKEEIKGEHKEAAKKEEEHKKVVEKEEEAKKKEGHQKKLHEHTKKGIEHIIHKAKKHGTKWFVKKGKG